MANTVTWRPRGHVFESLARPDLPIILLLTLLLLAFCFCQFCFHDEPDYCFEFLSVSVMNLTVVWSSSLFRSWTRPLFEVLLSFYAEPDRCLEFGSMMNTTVVWWSSSMFPWWPRPLFGICSHDELVRCFRLFSRILWFNTVSIGRYFFLSSQ